MTGGSKAYFSVHNASENTCVVLQKLIDLGAVFVGTTKTFAFSSVDISTDYLFPICNVQVSFSSTLIADIEDSEIQEEIAL